MPGGMPPADVVLATVRKELSQQTYRAIGTLRAKSRATIAAREAGTVLEILVNEGDSLAEGDVIARIDPRRIQAQLLEAQASSTAAHALIQQRLAEKKRFDADLIMKESLYRQKALSEREVLDARRSARVAETLTSSAQDMFAASEARVELLRVRQSDHEIRASFSGRVTERHTELGEWLDPGSPVVTITSSGEIEAWLQVPERFANIGNGQETTITLSASGRKITASKLTTVPEADTSSRTLQMVAVLPNSDSSLVPGLSISAELPVTEALPRLTVPVNAVVQSYSGPGVFIPEKSLNSPMPAAKRIPITVIFQENGQAFIESSELKEGDQVIVEGNERLFPAQPLIIHDSAKNKQSH